MNRVLRMSQGIALVCSFAVVGCGGGKSSGPTTPPPDTEGPSAITNLAVASVDTASITLGWTAPSNDGLAAASYELRVAEGSTANWSSMTPVAGLAAPKAPGGTETFRIGGLAMGTGYAFALRSRDASGNESPSSNTALGKTAETTVGADLVVSTKESGIWYSRNAGRTWHRAAVSDGRTSFGVLASDPQQPQVVYASGSYASNGNHPYLYRSSNAGANWEPVSGLFADYGAVSSIAVAPTSSSTIYVGVRGTCLAPNDNCNGQAGDAYRSTNGGSSWQRISSGLPTISGFGSVAVYSVAVHPTNAAHVAVGVFRNDWDTGYLSSTNSGGGWGRIQSNPPDYYVYTVAIDPADPLRVLVSTGSSDGIYLAERGLMSDFTKVSAMGGNQPIVFDPTDSRWVYTASQHSSDGGRTWAPISLPVGASAISPGKTALGVDPVSHEVYAAGSGGVYRSHDRGATWSEVRALPECTGMVVLP